MSSISFRLRYSRYRMVRALANVLSGKGNARFILMVLILVVIVVGIGSYGGPLLGAPRGKFSFQFDSAQFGLGNDLEVAGFVIDFPEFTWSEIDAELQAKGLTSDQRLEIKRVLENEFGGSS